MHHYCQTANALFLIAAVVLLIAEMIAVRKILYASVVGIALFGGAVIHIRDNEWPISTGRHDLNPGYLAAQLVRDSTAPNSSLIVFGVDWSSEINYYAERKGLALPGWASLQKAGAILANPDAYMVGLEVGAVIECRSVFLNMGPSSTSSSIVLSRPGRTRPRLYPAPQTGFLSRLRQRNLSGPTRGSIE